MFKNLLVVTTAALAMAAAAALPARADGNQLPGGAVVSVPEPTSILAIVVGGAIAAHAASKSKNN